MPIIDGFLKIRRCEVTKSVSGEPLDPPGLNRDCLATKVTFSSLLNPSAILCISSNSFLSVILVINEEAVLHSPLCQYQAAYILEEILYYLFNLLALFLKLLVEAIR